MSVWLWIVCGVAAAAAVAVVGWRMWRAGRPLRRLAASGIQGLCALAAVNVTGMFTGVSLGLGWFSAAVCCVLGVPGVVLLLLLKTVFAV